MDADMNNGNDNTDKWPFKKKSKQLPPKVISDNIVPVIHGNVDSDEYSMKPPLGKCLIFNHRIFVKNLERKGTEKDVESLYKILRHLGFEEVRIFNDLKVREIMEKLGEVAEKDHSQSSCFVCCFLTHGDNGLLCAQDGMYPIQSLYDIFNGNVCPTLRGKPKIFFIQACQGDKTDSGGTVICKESMDSKLLNIPAYADFLIMLSTFPGFVAFKNEFIGSYFIQCLCDVLKEHAQNKHLMDMLTIVTRKVAIYFESYNFKDESKDRKKQVPFIASTLTRFVKFPLKMLS